MPKINANGPSNADATPDEAVVVDALGQDYAVWVEPLADEEIPEPKKAARRKASTAVEE